MYQKILQIIILNLLCIFFFGVCYKKGSTLFPSIDPDLIQAINVQQNEHRTHCWALTHKSHRKFVYKVLGIAGGPGQRGWVKEKINKDGYRGRE